MQRELNALDIEIRETTRMLDLLEPRLESPLATRRELEELKQKLRDLSERLAVVDEKLRAASSTLMHR